MTLEHRFFPLAAAATAILLSAPMAEAAAKPGDFDLDKDGILTPSEQIAFEAYVATLDGTARPEASFYRDVLDELRDQGYPAGTAIPVAKILTYISPDECERKSGFVLRRNVTDRLLTDCTPQGAAVSFSRDSETGSSTLTINGGIAYRFLLPGIPPRQGADREGLSLSRHALAFFIQADGAHVSGQPDQGSIRTGLRWDMIFEGGPFDILVWTNQIYHQTDFELEGSAYGVKSRLTFQSLPNNIGGALRTPTDTHWTYTLFDLSLDAFRVEKAGGTNLTSGVDYAWLLVDGELVHENRRIGPHGSDARLKVRYGKDLRGGGDATWGELSLNMYLDASRQTALNLTYVKGEDYKTLEKEDKATVGISFWF